jgi:hypothetical protein
MNRRRGTSLIELIAVMGIGAVMMGVAVTLLYTLLRTEGSGRTYVRQSLVLSRLAEQFRRDVHAAKTSQALSDGQGRQFELAPGRTVTYRPERGTLSRTEQADGAVQRRESFVLPPGTAASVDVEADTKPTIASLVIAPVGEASRPPGGQAIRFDAVLAKDHRFISP